MWSGEEDELVECEDALGIFKGCPECITDAYLKDKDEIQDEIQE